jgi:phosphoglycolate phosphatase-like HAD superfamily hydrolase
VHATVRWRHEPLTGGPAVVFDIDGVLSDAARRQHFLNTPGRRKDWRAFFDACGEDPLITEVHRLLSLLRDDLAVILLSARPGRIVHETLAWLERYEVRWDLLLLRGDRNGPPAVEFKRALLGELRTSGFDLQLGFEDDPLNVAMFREEGVPCVYLHSGYYEGRGI